VFIGGLENLQFFLNSTETQASPGGLTHIEPNSPPAARPEHAPSSAAGMGLLLPPSAAPFHL